MQNCNFHKYVVGKIKPYILFQFFPGLFQCTTQNCEVTSKKKGNDIHHIRHCYVIAQEKRSVESNKICQHCGARFVKKSNRDRHVAIIHRDEPLAPLMSIQGAEEGELHEEVGSTLTPEQIIAATDDVIENNGMVSNVDESEVVFDASIGEQEVVFYISVDEEPVVNNDETMVDILAELSTIHEQGTKCCENTFITKVVEKISADLKGRFAKHNAAKFLVDSLGDLIKDTNFKSWLSQRLNYQPCRLQQIIKNYIQSENYKARHSLSANTHQKIYNFWLKPENSVTSTDRRSGRDEVRISKRKYLEEYRHLQSIQDENKEIKEITLKKTGTKKLTCMPSVWFIHNLFESCLICLKRKKAKNAH